MKQAMTKKDNAAIDPKAVAQMLADAERHLFSDSNKRAMELTLDWKNSFAKEAGVYVIFDEVAPLYVGESANLQKRMGHLRHTYHYTFRRSLGHELYSSRPDYEKATSKKRFSDAIEKELVKEMQKLAVCVISIALGRKEIEEFIIQKYDPKYNMK